MPKKYTKNEVLERLYKINGNNFNYDLISFTKFSDKVKIICNKCGKEFEQRLNSHLLGQKCPYCAGKHITKEDILYKFKAIHKNNYTYFDFQYKNKKQKIDIKCNKCGNIFKQRINVHLMGCGCRKCGTLKTAKQCSYSNETFLKKAKDIHGEKYEYPDLNYKNEYTKILIYCLKCGKYFYQDPHHHLKGCGCPYCKKSKGENKIKKFLEENEINYEFQKKFKDCRDKKVLPFDFYLPDYNMCIEYQGEQHYISGIKYFINFTKSKEKAIEKLKLLQKHDKIKKKYCKKNNIKLLEIKYNENIEVKLKLLLLKN